jgi:hypothetical protein
VIKIAPVRKQVTVSVSQQRAFEWFTKEMSRWWPATHSILKSPLKQYIVEPRVGGRWYAIAEDGSRFDPALITEVEVNFIAESAQSTRVELEHRNLQRMGERAAQVRGMVDAPGGWTAILEAFSRGAAASKQGGERGGEQ